MPKRATNALTLLSAVVCVGSLLLVGRSWFRSDMVRVPPGHLLVHTVHGQLVVRQGVPSESFDYINASAQGAGSDLKAFWQYLWGIRWLGIGFGRLGVTVLILPLWLLPLLTAIAPVRWWRNRRRERGRGFAVEAA